MSDHIFFSKLVKTRGKNSGLGHECCMCKYIIQPGSLAYKINYAEMGSIYCEYTCIFCRHLIDEAGNYGLIDDDTDEIEYGISPWLMTELFDTQEKLEAALGYFPVISKVGGECLVTYMHVSKDHADYLIREYQLEIEYMNRFK